MNEQLKKYWEYYFTDLLHKHMTQYLNYPHKTAKKFKVVMKDE